MKTRTALNLSLALNVAVLAGFAWLTAESRPFRVSPPTKPAAPESSILVSPTSDPAPLTPTARPSTNPFHWNQLESPDYRTYVANLRAIGCPELTIRDIIAADVDGLYSEKRQALHLAESGNGRWSGQEERQFVASLLGWRLEVEPSPASVAVTGVASTSGKPAVMPLVFRPVDLDKLHLNEGQKAAIAQLQEQFVAQIGGPDGDSADPAYRERWQRAQPEIDEMLRGMIGVTAFSDYQLDAATNAPDGDPATP